VGALSTSSHLNATTLSNFIRKRPVDLQNLPATTPERSLFIFALSHASTPRVCAELVQISLCAGLKQFFFERCILKRKFFVTLIFRFKEIIEPFLLLLYGCPLARGAPVLVPFTTPGEDVAMSPRVMLTFFFKK
jgi:hypothetical protein